MARMRDFEAEALAAARAAGHELTEVGHAVTGLFHHDPRPGPAGANPAIPVPAGTMAAAPAAAQQEEEPMSLAQIEDAVREDVTKGIDYAVGLMTRLQTAMPGIVSTVDAVGGSTVGKLAETLLGTIIPEPYESILIGTVEDFVKRHGQPAAAAPAEAAADGAAAQQ